MRNRPNRNRPAFTMIELLTVIAIIGIISGILVVGLKYVGETNQRRQTVGLLERLDNALVEITNSPGGAAKFYAIQLPLIYLPIVIDSTAENNVTWVGVPASALESQIRTGMVLKALAASPAAKAILDSTQTDRKATLTYTLNTVQVPPPGTSAGDYPMLLDAWGNPILFVYDNLQRPTGTNSSVPLTVKVGGANVIPGGLTNLISDADKSYWEPTAALDPVPRYTMPPPAKRTIDLALHLPYARASMRDGKYASYARRVGATGQVEPTFRSPDRRPFWFSAGPDGFYETHDDNVYSFGN